MSWQTAQPVHVEELYGFEFASKQLKDAILDVTAMGAIRPKVIAGAHPATEDKPSAVAYAPVWHETQTALVVAAIAVE